MDKGLEFIAVALADWAQQHDVALEFIQSSKPMQNGFIAMTTAAVRKPYWFCACKTIELVREQVEVWIEDQNEVLRHDSLRDLGLGEYRVLHHP